MAKRELSNPGNRGLRVKWWEWFVFAAALELYVPPKRKRKVEWWDWLVLAAVVSSAFLSGVRGRRPRIHGHATNAESARFAEATLRRASLILI
jgi:hypothetical protein